MTYLRQAILDTSSIWSHHCLLVGKGFLLVQYFLFFRCYQKLALAWLWMLFEKLLLMRKLFPQRNSSSRTGRNLFQVSYLYYCSTLQIIEKHVNWCPVHQIMSCNNSCNNCCIKTHLLAILVFQIRKMMKRRVRKRRRRKKKIRKKGRTPTTATTAAPGRPSTLLPLCLMTCAWSVGRW